MKDERWSRKKNHNNIFIYDKAVSKLTKVCEGDCSFARSLTDSDMIFGVWLCSREEFFSSLSLSLSIY